nr:pseudouridine synthase [Xanthomonas maliensis]
MQCIAAARVTITTSRSAATIAMPAAPQTYAGTPASRFQLPAGPWVTVLDALCACFPAIAPERWRERFARGLVRDADGRALALSAPYRVGAEIRYFREVADEPVIPYVETVVHADADLVVACKPHFLPVAPAGAYVRETLLTRLAQRLDNPALVPLHRIDRETAGLVLFSANPATRGIYQALFRERRIRKHYLAVAPPLPLLTFPHVHRSRLEPGTPFFRMQEGAGAPNSETVIDVVARGTTTWTYRLEPVTGRKHQLRVHMAALGAAILHDRYYPLLEAQRPDDPQRALQLYAHTLVFDDPCTGERRHFTATRAPQTPI